MKIEFSNNISYCYPIILVPKKIIRAIKKEYTEEEIVEKLEIKPPLQVKIERPPYKVELTNYRREKVLTTQLGPGGIGLITWTVGCIIVSLFVDFGLILSIIPIALLFLSINLLSNIERKTITIKTPKSQEEINELNIKYEKDLIIFEKHKNRIIKLNTIEREKHSNQLNEAVSKYKEKEYLNSLKPLFGIKRNRENLKRGKSEFYFLKLLLSHYGNKIKMDSVINRTNYYYYPDFVYVCNDSGLHIDIEVDEPYTLRDKSPIHYTNSNDDNRNNFFLRHNWIVIRLTEKQITKEPSKCIDLIDSIIKNVLKKKTTFKNEVTEERRWSYEEALLMASKDYRNKY